MYNAFTETSQASKSVTTPTWNLPQVARCSCARRVQFPAWTRAGLRQALQIIAQAVVRAARMATSLAGVSAAATLSQIDEAPPVS